MSSRLLAVGFVDGSDAVSLPRRFRYTFELYLSSEKLHQFGLETADALHSWTRSIGKVWLVAHR